MNVSLKKIVSSGLLGLFLGLILGLLFFRVGLFGFNRYRDSKTISRIMDQNQRLEQKIAKLLAENAGIRNALNEASTTNRRIQSVVGILSTELGESTTGASEIRDIIRELATILGITLED